MNTILKASAAVAALLILQTGAANATCGPLIGTSGDDTLIAVPPGTPPCGFTIQGLAGDDTLIGAGGPDRLWPGSQSMLHTGHDTMTGNGGNDIFFIEDAPGATGVDAQEITDFTHGTEKIVVFPVCNAHSVTCSFIGSSMFSGTAGEIRYALLGGTGSDGLLQFDLDGNSVSDLEVVLDGGPTVTSGDILFSIPPKQQPLETSSK